MSPQGGAGNNAGPPVDVQRDPSEQLIWWHTVDVMTRRQILQDMLEAIFHALKCNFDEKSRVYPIKCTRPDCDSTRITVAHVVKCLLGSQCTFENCIPFRVVLNHSQNCKETTTDAPYACWLCGPFHKQKHQLNSALEKCKQYGIRDCKVVMHDFNKDLCPLASVQQNMSKQ